MATVTKNHAVFVGGLEDKLNLGNPLVSSIMPIARNCIGACVQIACSDDEDPTSGNDVAICSIVYSDDGGVTFGTVYDAKFLCHLYMDSTPGSGETPARKTLFIEHAHTHFKLYFTRYASPSRDMTVSALYSELTVD